MASLLGKLKSDETDSIIFKKPLDKYFDRDLFFDQNIYEIDSIFYRIAKCHFI